LKFFFRQVQHRYVKPPSYSFEVAALASSDMATPDERDAYADLVLRALNNGATPQLTGLPYQFYESNNAAAVRAQWGEDFAAALSTLKTEDGWRRLDSKHGPLLVKLAEVKQSEVPDFEIVKNNLLVDWRRQQQAAVVRRKVAELRKNYQVSWQGAP
jgi:hypothetical protein